MYSKSNLQTLCRAILSIAALCTIMSCASHRSAGQTSDAAPEPVPAPPSAPLPALAPEQPETVVADARQEIIERGSGSFIGSQPARTGTEDEPGDINLRFEGSDIKEFAETVLGDLLGVNYVIDPAVTGTVTIQTRIPITRDQLLPLFEEILGVNGAALVRSNNLYSVVSRASLRDSSLATSGGADVPGYRTQVIPLRFVAAEEMQRILASVVADPTTLRIDSARNLIIASGNAAQIAAIQETIDVFDVDWLRGMSIGLFPLDNVDPKTLEAELTEVLGAATGQADTSLLGGLVRLVPLERLTSLLVVSTTAAALREVEIWIRRLDQPGESAGQRLYVYPVQNAKASELADILGGIFQSRAAARGSSRPARDVETEVGRARLAPGLAPTQIRPRGMDSLRPSSVPASSLGATATPNDISPVSEGLELSGNSTIEIIADDVRNALVILAAPQDYRMVEAAIRKLDVVPLQVLIEASILEVALRDDLSYGVEWFLRRSIDDGDKEGFAALDLGDAGIGALAPGFSYTVIDNAARVRLALNLLANESEVNVLSSPSLMVLDNQTATINVGDEIPVPARQSISNLDPVSPTVNEITFRQTGVTLSVTPRVNNSGLVTMDIRQQVATAAPTTSSNIDAPTIQNREIESVVAINSGDTIVLGGLMQDQQSSGESGLPGLRRIPGLGKLFGRTDNAKARTELLVLITPRVVRNRDDARLITDEFRKSLPQLQLRQERAAEEQAP